MRNFALTAGSVPAVATPTAAKDQASDMKVSQIPNAPCATRSRCAGRESPEAQIAMDGERAARALEEHFEAIRRAELLRLGKKLAGLRAEERATVEAVTLHIVHAIAAAPSRVLARDESQLLVRTVLDLFQVS
jgi:hypothetical protein